jgi:hypothetical protein
LAKAEEYSRLAVSADNAADRTHYARMRRKWLGIAHGWHTIINIGNTGDQ